MSEGFRYNFKRLLGREDTSVPTNEYAFDQIAQTTANMNAAYEDGSIDGFDGTVTKDQHTGSWTFEYNVWGGRAAAAFTGALIGVGSYLLMLNSTTGRKFGLGQRIKNRLSNAVYTVTGNRAANNLGKNHDGSHTVLPEQMILEDGDGNIIEASPHNQNFESLEP